MECVKCYGFNTKVITSRPHPGHRDRKRKCLDCGKVFSTVEISAEMPEPKEVDMQSIEHDIAFQNRKERRRQLIETYVSAFAIIFFLGAIAFGILKGIGLL